MESAEAAPAGAAEGAAPTPLGLFATLDEDAMRHLITSFLDGADLVKLAACRCVGATNADKERAPASVAC